MVIDEISRTTRGGDISVALSRSEGSLAWGVQMLRCAQHDRALIPKVVQVISLKSIIGPYRGPIHFIN